MGCRAILMCYQNKLKMNRPQSQNMNLSVAINHIMRVSEFNSVNLLVELCKLRQRAGSAGGTVFCFCRQRSFLFFPLKHVGHEQMFIHPNYASNYASLTATRTQCLHCQVSGWQDMKAMPLTQFLPPSLPHIFGTIIPLFNSAVWSCFTPVHPHWLPFCPISPPLIRLCVISNDSQKMAVHIRAPHATTMPVIQFNINTS